MEDLGIGKVDHIGIAVRDLEAAIPFYRDVLGLRLHEVEEVADQGVVTAVFVTGESRLELLAPTRADSPVARFLEKRGEGIHHLALGVADVAEALALAAKRGCALIDRTPRVGAGGALIAFVHPRSTGGVLLEFCQRRSAE